MPVSLYSVGVNVLGGDNGNVSVRNAGVQTLGRQSGAVAVHKIAAQMLYVPLSRISVYSYACSVMFRAEVDPLTGGYQARERFLSPVEGEDMIYTDMIFPRCVSYGSSSVPRYQTNKSEVLSGDEQRNTRWEYPKHEYNIRMENMDAQEVAEIMNLWHICSGDYIAFLFMDPLDHTSNNKDGMLSNTEVSADDQIVASAVGGVSDYPLYKYYQKNNHFKRRRIFYPIKDTVKVAVGGIETTQFEISYEDKVLRFTQPVEDLVLTVSKNGNVITRDDGDPWTEFNVGDLVMISGFSNSADNFVSVNGRVQSIDNDQMTMQRFDGSVYGGARIEASVEITLNSGLPATGAPITAGFYFYVPVRFEEGDNATSEITGGLRESVFADFSDIKLKEVFE